MRTCPHDCKYCRGKERHRRLAALHKKGFTYATLAAQERVSASFVRKMVEKGRGKGGT